MYINDIHSWELAWQKARVGYIHNRGKNKEGIVSHWNKRAKNFSCKVMQDEERVQEVFQWLENQGVVIEGAKILDIGSGPGAFALAFAEKGGEVTALEPAEAMTLILQEELAKRGLEDVRILQKTWEDIDIKKESFKGTFDLVFASMCPGINNWETLQKALNCAKKYCYFSQFAGKRCNEHYSKVWSLIFNEEMPPWPNDYYYILNLLYNGEYDYSTMVWQKKRKEEVSVEKATASFMDFLLLYKEKNPGMAEKIKEYVKEEACRQGNEGLFRQEMTTRLGQVLIEK